MPTAFYITHPQVAIDPAVPVPRWGLSALGAARAAAMAAQPWVRGIRRIVSSEETKAVETASILAGGLGLTAQTRPNLNENDRSATGYLPPPEFEATADLFFAHPQESVRGWERACDAQARIVRAVEDILDEFRPGGGDIALVGHGGVGALLLCHLLGAPIGRLHDQKNGGGNVFAFDMQTRAVLNGWTPIDSPRGSP